MQLSQFTQILEIGLQQIDGGAFWRSVSGSYDYILFTFGNADASLLSPYETELIQALSNMIAVPTHEIFITEYEQVGSDAVVTFGYPDTKTWVPTIAGSASFGAAYLNQLRDVEGLNVILGLVYSYITSFQGVSSTDVSPYSSSILAAFAETAGISTSAISSFTITQNGDNTDLTFISSSNAADASAMQAAIQADDWQVNWELALSNIDGLNLILGLLTQWTYTITGLASSEFTAYETELLQAFANAAGVSLSDDITLSITGSGLTTNFVYTILSSQASGLLQDDFASNYQSELAQISGLNQLLGLVTGYTYTFNSVTTTELQSYSAELLTAFATAMGIPESEVSISSFTQSGGNADVIYLYSSSRSIPADFAIAFSNALSSNEGLRLLLGLELACSSFGAADLTSYWYSTLSLSIESTTDLCTFDGTFRIRSGGVLYDTCVGFGDFTASCDQTEVVCGAGNEYGYHTDVSPYLSEALSSPAFLHPSCPKDNWNGELTFVGVPTATTADGVLAFSSDLIGIMEILLGTDDVTLGSVAKSGDSITMKYSARIPDPSVEFPNLQQDADAEFRQVVGLNKLLFGTTDYIYSFDVTGGSASLFQQDSAAFIDAIVSIWGGHVSDVYSISFVDGTDQVHVTYELIISPAMSSAVTSSSFQSSLLTNLRTIQNFEQYIAIPDEHITSSIEASVFGAAHCLDSSLSQTASDIVTAWDSCFWSGGLLVSYSCTAPGFITKSFFDGNDACENGTPTLSQTYEYGSCQSSDVFFGSSNVMVFWTGDCLPEPSYCGPPASLLTFAGVPLSTAVPGNWGSLDWVALPPRSVSFYIGDACTSESVRASGTDVSEKVAIIDCPTECELSTAVLNLQFLGADAVVVVYSGLDYILPMTWDSTTHAEIPVYAVSDGIVAIIQSTPDQLIEITCDSDGNPYWWCSSNDDCDADWYCFDCDACLANANFGDGNCAMCTSTDWDPQPGNCYPVSECEGNRAPINDLACPVYAEYESSAIAQDGQELTIRFNNQLQSGQTIDCDAFVVTSGITAQSTKAVNSCTVAGSVVYLLLGSPVQSGAATTLTYIAPDSGYLLSVDGVRVPSFSADDIENDSDVDLTAPILQSVSVASTGNRITFAFDEPLDGQSDPPVSDFTVIANYGQDMSVGAVLFSGNELILFLTDLISAGCEVEVTYTSGTPEIQDTSGNPSGSFSTKDVENLSTIDIVGPTLTDASLVSTTTSAAVSLTFDEDIDIDSLDPSKLSLDVDGISIPVSSITTTDGALNVIVLEINQGIGQHSVVSLVVEDGNITDLNGNSANLSTASVINNSSVDLAHPSVTGAKIHSSGNVVEISFDEGFQSNLNQVGSATDYTVTVGGSDAVPVTSFYAWVDNNIILLSLGSIVEEDDYVEVTVAAGTICDDFGNCNTAPITIRPPTLNNESTRDTKGPVVTSGHVLQDGLSIVLEFNEDIVESVTTSQFSISTGETITSLAHETSNSITLFLDSSIESGVPVLVTYTDPTASDDLIAIQDENGHDSGSFSFSVENLSEIDTTGPQWTHMSVDTTGAFVTVDYNEDISTTDGLSRFRFSVCVDGNCNFPSSIDVIGSSVLLTGEKQMSAVQDVQVSYSSDCPRFAVPAGTYDYAFVNDEYLAVYFPYSSDIDFNLFMIQAENGIAFTFFENGFNQENYIVKFDVTESQVGDFKFYIALNECNRVQDAKGNTAGDITLRSVDENPSTFINPTVSPSKSPTASPSDVPTVKPTLWPTAYCPSFVVGYERCNSTLVDLFVILDSSTSIPQSNFTLIKETMAERVLGLADGTRMALMQFSTTTNTIFDFTNTLTNAEKAVYIENMQLLGGATFTKRAIEKGWDVWQDSLANEDRTPVTVIITDGEPSQNQDPCEAVQQYFDAGIINVVIGVDVDTSSASCMASSGQYFPFVNDYWDALDRTFGSIETACDTVYTPFDAYFLITDEVENGMPVYRTVGDENFVAKFNSSHWYIYDGNTGEYMFQVENVMNGVPATAETWIYKDRFGRDIIYNDIPIQCFDTPDPTSVPSKMPTDLPSKTPTKNPSKSPTQTPSITPSFEPSVSPSRHPSLGGGALDKCTSLVIAGTAVDYVGGYMWRPGQEENNRPTYVNNRGMVLQYQNNRWQIEDGEKSTILAEVDAVEGDGLRPAQSELWVLTFASGESQVHQLTTVCSDTTIPTYNPSVVPSIAPSTSPTIICPHLELFTGICKKQANTEVVDSIDMMFLLDGSDDVSSTEWDDLKESLAIAIEHSLPQSAGVNLRIAIVQYGGATAEIEMNFDDFDNLDDWLEVVYNMDQVGGSANLAAGVEIATSLFYTSALDAWEHDQILQIYSNGGVEGSNACDLQPGLSDVLVQTIIIGDGVSLDKNDNSDITCLANPSDQTFYPARYGQISSVINDMNVEMCADPSPFDRSYNRLPQERNGKFVYESDAENIISWDGSNWVIENAQGDFLATNAVNDLGYPPDKENWVHTDNGGSDSYERLRIVCSWTAMPTSTPSRSPSSSPTISEPSITPSVHPTIDPSKTPSETPSAAPTATDPSRTPSGSPSVIPSDMPSGHPSISSPTSTPSFEPSAPPIQLTCHSFIVTNVCPGQGPTPFDGGYSQTGTSTASRAIFSHTHNMNAYYNSAAWVFQSDFGLMIEKTPSATLLPPTGKEWQYFDNVGNFVEFCNLEVICSDTTTPTRTPSDAPSRGPSKQPSGNPSRMPSSSPTATEPTGTPTKSPSRTPSGNPSVDPTGLPSSNPSRTPSIEPTVSSPSGTPSKTPSGAPVESPTVNPTLAPLACDCPNLNLYRRGACGRIEYTDVLFIIDSSSSVKEEMYAAMKQWLIYVVQTILTDETRIAMMQFASSVRPEFDFDKYNNAAEAIAHIAAMEPVGGATRTSEAIQYAIESMIPLNPFNRDLVIITITDGQPTDGYSPCPLASQFLATNPISIVVGIGSQLYEDLDQVSCIGSSPQYVFWIEQLSDLSSILGNFESELCEEATPYDGYYERFDFASAGAKYRHWEDDFVLQYGTVDATQGNDAIATFEDGEQSTFQSWGFRSGRAAVSDYWFILDNSGNYIATDKPDNECYPPVVGNWTYYNTSTGRSVTFEMISYCFNVTSSPTTNPSGTPSGSPSDVPTIEPSNLPSKIPTGAPTPLSSPPTEYPTPKPTDLPSGFPTPDCPNICVNGSWCQFSGGVDFAFVIDSSNDLPLDQHVIDFFVNVVDDVIPDPNAPSDFGQLSLIQYTDDVNLRFPLNYYWVKDDWIEHLRGMEDLNVPGETTPTDTLPAVQQAYLQLQKNGHIRDKVMYVMTDGGSLTDLCGVGSVIETWGMFVIVIVVGPVSNLEKIRLECLASTAGSFIQIDSTDELSDIDVWDITCPNPTPFDGQYQRMDDMLGGHYQYMSSYKWHLSFPQETWVFEAPWCVMTARGGADQLRAPDRQTWDAVCDNPPDGFDSTGTYEFVRISCCGPMPTLSPSLTPTSPPSPIAPTKQPSKTPSGTPSSTPTTPGPTGTPSDMPSTDPTSAPTPTCENFLIYRNDSCWEYTRLMDIVIIMDSSSSITPDNYARMRDTLAEGLPNFLPESANVAFLQYNHGQHLEFSFDDNLSQQEYRQKISEMEQLGGGTYTAAAVQYSLDNLWPQSTRSSKLLMTITDGQPSEGQTSCPVLIEASAQGIDIIMVAVGASGTNQQQLELAVSTQQEAQDPCALAVNKVQLFAEYIFDDEYIADIFEGTCRYGTPFDAGYSLTDHEWALSGAPYPTYRSSDGSVVYHNGFTWSVVNSEIGEMTAMREMTEYFPDDGYPPLIGHSWNITWNSGASAVYDRIIVECVSTATPTRQPTNSMPTLPTTTTTSTEKPSPNPTVIPTALPTTISTEKISTQSPTDMPVTSTPTSAPTIVRKSPSKHPASGSPTVSPTFAPTTDAPSFMPTTGSPTLLPSTSKPSKNPTPSPTTSPVENFEVEFTFTSLLSCDMTQAIASHNYYLQLSEIYFYDGDQNRITYTSFVVPDSDSPGSEKPEKVADGNTLTKWLDRSFSCEGPGVVGVASGFSQIPVYYTFVTGNDSPPRDPNSWQVRICRDDVCDSPLNVQDQIPPSGRRTEYSTLYDFLPVSSEPSFIPSTSPTVKPLTTSPSTSRPSRRPSPQPFTSRPTDRPTTKPSNSLPSNIPSFHPTTSKPSGNPTVSPTNLPISTKPTLQPSDAPIHSQPTDMPFTSSPSKSPFTSSPTPIPIVSTPTGYPTATNPGDCGGMNVEKTNECLKARIYWLERELEDTREECASDRQYCEDTKVEIINILASQR